MSHSVKGRVVTRIILDTFKLNGLLVQAGDRLGEESGLSSARWKVLGALAGASRPLTVPQVARGMGLTRQAVQRVANEMGADGLIAFEQNPDHKRAKLLVMTAEGRERYAQVTRKQIPWADGLSEGIDQTDLDATADVLRRLIETLERQA